MIQLIADGRTDLVIEHIESGGGAFDSDTNGVKLIQWCAYYGDVTAVKLLIKHGEKLDSLGPNFDLNGACFHGHWRLVQYLIGQGADVSFPLEETGETPLHSALSKANRPAYDLVVEVLLANGADPNVRSQNNAETGAFMRDARTKGETPLHRAAAFGTERSIDLLIRAGADKNAEDMNGDTPLAWASWHLRPAAILEKLAYGPHRINAAHIELYKGDHGSGFGGLESSLLGKPHFDDQG